MCKFGQPAPALDHSWRPLLTRLHCHSQASRWLGWRGKRAHVHPRGCSSPCPTPRLLSSAHEPDNLHCDSVQSTSFSVFMLMVQPSSARVTLLGSALGSAHLEHLSAACFYRKCHYSVCRLVGLSLALFMWALTTRKRLFLGHRSCLIIMVQCIPSDHADTGAHFAWPSRDSKRHRSPRGVSRAKHLPRFPLYAKRSRQRPRRRQFNF